MCLAQLLAAKLVLDKWKQWLLLLLTISLSVGFQCWSNLRDERKPSQTAVARCQGMPLRCCKRESFTNNSETSHTAELMRFSQPCVHQPAVSQSESPVPSLKWRFQKFQITMKMNTLCTLQRRYPRHERLSKLCRVHSEWHDGAETKINPDSSPGLSSDTQHGSASPLHRTASDGEKAGAGLDAECLKGDGTEQEGPNVQDKVCNFPHCSYLWCVSSWACPGRESTQTWFVLGATRHLYTGPGSTLGPILNRGPTAELAYTCKGSLSKVGPVHKYQGLHGGTAYMLYLYKDLSIVYEGDESTYSGLLSAPTLVLDTQGMLKLHVFDHICDYPIMSEEERRGSFLK